jgi:hypothetical protein
MGKAVKYPAEARQRTVRMLREHEHEYGSRWADRIDCRQDRLHSAPLQTWGKRVA